MAHSSKARPLVGSRPAPNHAATAGLSPRVYDELRRVARRQMASERPNHTLQPTAVVHEAFIRLAGEAAADDHLSRTRFFALAAAMIRRVLVDHARRKHAMKRGGRRKGTRIGLDEIEADWGEPADLLALDDALSELATLNERQARVI